MPVDTYIKYAHFIGVEPSTEENKEIGELPQHYADMFGWEEMVAAITNAYDRLSPEEQSRCAIFTSNYGEAGAVDFLGRDDSLPKAISGHNNYWLWGPRDATGEVVIYFGGPSIDTLKTMYEEVELVDVFQCDYCMPYENKPVYICKRIHASFQEIWTRLKHYD